MFSTRHVSVRIVALTVTCFPMTVSADTEVNIDVGRAQVLIERASDGISTLLGAQKVHLSEQWSIGLEEKAADLCAFVAKKLKKERLEDKEVSLCSVE